MFKLTPEQSAAARARWQGSPDTGFKWLATEIEAAFGVTLTRTGLKKIALREGWEKTGDQVPPLAIVPVPGEIAGMPGVTPERLVADQLRKGKPGNRKLGNRGTGEPGEQADPETGLVVSTTTDGQVLVAPTPGALKYKPEYAQQLIEYFDVEPYKEVEVDGFNGTKKVQLIPQPPPMLGLFAHQIGVTLETLNGWATAVTLDGAPRFPEFSEAYARARQLQEALFVRATMVGAYSDRAMPFVLKNLHGWTDKPQEEVKADPVSMSELDERFARIMAAAQQSMRTRIEERRSLRLTAGMEELQQWLADDDAKSGRDQ
jgi:hypothetical protein